jgi:hypothetical protein
MQRPTLITAAASLLCATMAARTAPAEDHQSPMNNGSQGHQPAKFWGDKSFGYREACDRIPARAAAEASHECPIHTRTGRRTAGVSP